MTTPSDLSRLDEIEARLKAATSGPWYLESNPPYIERHILAMRGPIQVCPALANGISDAELIAHAPTDIAWLASRLRAAMGVVEAAIETQDRLAYFEDGDTTAEKKRRRRRAVMREGMNKIFALAAQFRASEAKGEKG